MKNYVTIDPSIVSTAMVVNGRIFNYAAEHIAFNKSGLKKWYKSVEHLVTYRFHNYVKSDDYSESEILKLKQYTKTVDVIINDIKENINPELETIVKIEGYSYGSPEGYLIDLVTFSTLLRSKLSEFASEIIVIAPKSLKIESAKLTYDPIPKNKKGTILEYRNHIGIAGGSFSKHDMYQALTDNKKFNDDFVKTLRVLKDEIFELSKIEKPLEDIVDAFLMYKTLNFLEN